MLLFHGRVWRHGHRLGSGGNAKKKTSLSLLILPFLLFFDTLPLSCQDGPDFTSTSCRGRCSLHAMAEDHATCQCDGICLTYRDCCSDYLARCLKLTKVKKDETQLFLYIGIIVGGVIFLVGLLAVIYYCAVQNNDYRKVEDLNEEYMAALRTMDKGPSH